MTAWPNAVAARAGVGPGNVTARVILTAAVVAAVVSACESTEHKALRDYLYSSYYSTLAKERGDILNEFATLALTVDSDSLPQTPDLQYKALPILENWVKWRQHFDEVTAKDDADPRIKPIREKYREGDNLWTYALTQWFSAADSATPLARRRALYADYADAYHRALQLLTEAHDMVEKAMD